MFAGLALASATLAVAAVAILGVAVYFRGLTTEPSVVVEVVDPLTQQEAAFLTVVEQGESALDEHDLAALGRSVRTLEDMTAADPDLLARRQALRDVLEIRLELEAIGPLVEEDPEKALERALALQVLHPEDAAVAALVQRAREAVEAKKKASASRPVRPAPASAPPPAPTGGPSMLSVKGTPAGAEVVVDGRVVGKVPMELVIDAGTHDVSLRMEGYVQRRVHVQATGEPVEVNIDLPALQAAP